MRRAPLDSAAVQAVAMDLDRTILGQSLELTDRLVSGVAAVRDTGIEPIIATGRMLRSSLPYAKRLGITAPVVCYQGALVADPVTGEWLFHDPLPVPVARDVIRRVEAAGHHVNVYVDDQLYVGNLNEEALEYARHSRLDPVVVDDLPDWLEEPTTKLVVVGEPAALDDLADELRSTYGGTLFIVKSLPHFLEIAQPGVSKGSGLHFVCTRLGIPPGQVIGFGDGANDVELLEEAGWGVAVADADASLLRIADQVVPSVLEDGVADFLHALALERRVDSAAG